MEITCILSHIDRDFNIGDNIYTLEYAAVGKNQYGTITNIVTAKDSTRGPLSETEICTTWL